MGWTFPGAGGGCGLLSFFVGFLRGGMCRVRERGAWGMYRVRECGAWGMYRVRERGARGAGMTEARGM